MKVVVDNLLINYLIEGKKSGKTILMLHGWANDLTIFQQIASKLAKHYRVLRLDLPGFGGSQIPSKAWKIIDYGRLVKNFCLKVGFRPEILIGHSFGGRIIIKMVSEAFIQPKKIVLFNSAGVKASNFWRSKLLKAAAKGGKIITYLPGIRKFRQGLRNKFYQKIGSDDYLQSGAMRSIFINAVNEDLRQDASKIKVPTLLIWGEKDNQTPLRQAHILNRQIKKSRLEVLSSAGHFSFIDEPTKTLKLIEQFLNE